MWRRAIIFFLFDLRESIGSSSLSSQTISDSKQFFLFPIDTYLGQNTLTEDRSLIPSKKKKTSLILLRLPSLLLVTRLDTIYVKSSISFLFLKLPPLNAFSQWSHFPLHEWPSNYHRCQIRYYRNSTLQDHCSSIVWRLYENVLFRYVCQLLSDLYQTHQSHRYWSALRSTIWEVFLSLFVSIIEIYRISNLRNFMSNLVIYVLLSRSIRWEDRSDIEKEN